MANIKYAISKVELQKNGYYLSRGMLILDDDSKTTSWEVISGRYGRGTIPLGIYKVNKPEILEDKKDFIAYKKEGFPWVCKLNPIGVCADDKGPRNGLYIHPDGNLEGTLGCIGIVSGDIDFYFTLKKTLKNVKELMLYVY